MPFPYFPALSLQKVCVNKVAASGGKERKERKAKKSFHVWEGESRPLPPKKVLLCAPNSPLACVVTGGKFLFLVAKHAGTRGEGNSFFWNWPEVFRVVVVHLLGDVDSNQLIVRDHLANDALGTQKNHYFWQF